MAREINIPLHSPFNIEEIERVLNLNTNPIPDRDIQSISNFDYQTSFKKGNIPWNNGKSFSQETKDKISASLLGVKNKPLCPVIQMDLEGNFIEEFESITEASIKTNSSLSKICSVCKGNRKSTNNFKWKYK